MLNCLTAPGGHCGQRLISMLEDDVEISGHTVNGTEVAR